MKKHKILSFAALSFSVALSLALVFCPPAWAGKQLIDLYPNEVIVHQYPNFSGELLIFTLDPGMRLKQAPVTSFQDISSGKWKGIGSIHVGSKVNVWAFLYDGFRAKSHECSSPTGQYPWGDFLITSSSAFLKCDYKSLIIFPEDDAVVGGIALVMGDGGVTYPTWWKFYSVPESGKKREKCYQKVLNFQGATKARVIQPVKRVIPAHYSSLIFGSSGKNWVEATLYDHYNCTGNALTLPQPGSDKTDFDLKKYGFAYKVRSLKVRWTGPIAPSEGRTRAPEAPTPKWEEPGTDRPGSNYKPRLGLDGESWGVQADFGHRWARSW